MSIADETASIAPSFRLKILGTLILHGTDGQTVVADHGQKGVQLALLAVLASAGERGCSRDRLLLLFWPDASQKRARHSLEQLLYKMRKSMGENLFLGVNPIRLNPAVITTDTGDFQLALEMGDPEAAISHYQGPFLDGFYLSDSPEFEQWMIAERARLEAEYAKALDRLAHAAEDTGDRDAAVRWWSKLSEVDSLSARNALGLMRALANARDHAAALRHAEQYGHLVEQELGTSAGPEIASLAAEIRARVVAEASAIPDSTVGDIPLGRHLSVAPSRGSSDLASAPAIPPAGDHRRKRRILPYAVAFFAIAAGAFAATRLRDTPRVRPEAVPSGPSIAVLPLASLSTDPADDELADGMTHELIAMLSRASDLRVIGSTSVFALENRGMDVRQIGESLGVSHVLEGGLQKVGSRLRMQVRLVEAQDGSTHWSNTYDREMGDILAVQEEISFAVARELDVRLTGGGHPGSILRRHIPNSEAYEWYLRGTSASLLEGNNRQGIEHLDRAIAADSHFAGAYARLAWLSLNQAGAPPGDHREWVERARRAALKAVSLDDSLPEAHAALGWVLYSVNDYPAAEAELERAIALSPDVYRGYEGLARIYMMTGRSSEQLAMARLGADIDPLSIQAMRELALALSMNGRCDETLALLRPLKSLSPPPGMAGVIMGLCYARKEMWPEAIAEFRWVTEKTDARAGLAFLGYSLARAGQREEAMGILSDLEAGRRYSHGAFGIAVVHTGLGNYDQAFAWLDKAVEERSVRVYLMDPLFDDLHRDPRFERVRARLGIQKR